MGKNAGKPLFHRVLEGFSDCLGNRGAAIAHLRHPDPGQYPMQCDLSLVLPVSALDEKALACVLTVIFMLL